MKKNMLFLALSMSIAMTLCCGCGTKKVKEEATQTEVLSEDIKEIVVEEGNGEAVENEVLLTPSPTATPTPKEVEEETEAEIGTKEVQNEQVDISSFTYPHFELTTVREETSATFATEDEVDVVFMGNSLIRVDSVSKKVGNIADAYGYHFNIHELSSDGASLASHFKSIAAFKSSQECLADADIVIFQEYGKHYDDTIESMHKIIDKYCPNAEIYYFTTLFDTYLEDYYKEIVEDPKIHLIPVWESIAEILLQSGAFTIDDLLLESDYHPTDLQGTLSSLMVFSKITGQKCIDYPNMSVEDSFFSIIPGNDLEEKKEVFTKLYGEVDNFLENAENYFDFSVLQQE